MVVTAIIAVSITVGGVGGNRYWLNQRGLSAALEQLRGDMQRARLLAVKQNVNCVITIDGVNNQYTISPSNKVVRLGDYRGGVVFTGPSMGAVANITFSPVGTCTFGAAGCGAGQVHLTDQGNASPAPNGNTHVYRLRVSAAGGISKHVWNGANWVSTRI
jgi:hypothetical protein